MSLELESTDGSGRVQIDAAYSIGDIPIRAGHIRTEATKWSHLDDIKFDELENDEVNLLIGCDVSEAHWVLEQRIGKRNEPFAVRTTLGWILHGLTPEKIKGRGMLNYLTDIGDQLDQQLRSMYNKDFEDVLAHKKAMSLDDKTALKRVEAGSRLVDGHFEIPVPWRHPISFEDNRSQALKRMFCLKRRLSKDRVLLERYAAVIDRHLSRGYIEQCHSKVDAGDPCWYLPHHAVLNPKKPDKVRVVFDCSAKYNGCSLNDKLFSGPDVTANLAGVLTRFRLGLIAVSSDIEEMFLQVRLPERDRNAFRFLWWTDNDPSQELVEYRMTSHPFGATSSPFCASFALQQSGGANLNESLVSNFYVDDCLKSFTTKAEAKAFINDIIRALRAGGFRLRNWMSNDLEVLESIPESERAMSLVDITPECLPSLNTLGLQWDASSDELCVTAQPLTQSSTRRGCLSYLASVYDPLGFASPWLLEGKLILQSLCRKGLGWDEPIDEPNRSAWIKWSHVITNLNTVRVPRCIRGIDVQSKWTELHVFCDASEVAYGAVAYARSTSVDGKTVVALLLSKCRVAPLKPVTVPRLELMAAVLGSKLSVFLNDELKGIFKATVLWTDSMIVLHYIRNTTTRFSTFVANRLSTIHDCSHAAQWQHVGTSDNPADILSRGFQRRTSTALWFHGPKFLSEEHSEWPVQMEHVISQESLELKKTVQQVCMTIHRSVLSSLISYHSRWQKLVRSIAWLVRFKTYIIRKTETRQAFSVGPGRLSCEEMLSAEMDVIRLVQRSSFADDIALLERTSDITILPKSSKLRALAPILVDGILRVSGRLEYSSASYDSKHPIILPAKHHVVDLIVRYYHENERHAGPSHVLAAIRNRFWVIQGGKVVKRLIGRCFSVFAL